MNAPILAPAAILILWSLIMLVWLAATRLPALSKAGLDLSGAGGRGQDIDPQLPPSVAWKSHNYAHLMEQPTLFYAVVVLLTLVGQGDGLNAQLARAYVGIRIAHSLWQVLVNTIPIRFGLFILSTISLFTLSINLVIATLL
ncbi:MAPEG family protein [Pseudomonadales bacterium]|nr:MAPEG family protein [Pseudomonadales bacterium]